MKKKIRYKEPNKGSGKKTKRTVREKEISYADENIGNIKVVEDFLPKPEELVLRDNTVNITLNLSKSSVEFFKKLAEKHNSQYQKLIKNLLDTYTSRYLE